MTTKLTSWQLPLSSLLGGAEWSALCPQAGYHGCRGTGTPDPTHRSRACAGTGWLMPRTDHVTPPWPTWPSWKLRTCSSPRQKEGSSGQGCPSSGHSAVRSCKTQGGKYNDTTWLDIFYRFLTISVSFFDGPVELGACIDICPIEKSYNSVEFLSSRPLKRFVDYTLQEQNLNEKVTMSSLVPR